MRYLLVFLFVFALSLGGMGTGNATLIDNGGGFIYDTDLDITWYQHPNNSSMYWIEADTWAKGLNLGVCRTYSIDLSK